MNDFDSEEFSEKTDTPNSYDMDIWDENPDKVLPNETEDSIREVGFPDELAPYWHYQGYTNDCALYAQGGVLEADGKSFDIDKYREQAISDGSYDPEEGTYINRFGDLLESNGTEVNRYENATIQDMASELDQGHGVVVAVDCEPIWGEPGGHALWITGMEVGDDGVPISIISNDSGREDGQSIKYPFDNFMDAWGSYGNVMVSTVEGLQELQ